MLRKYKRLAERQGGGEVLAVATSAIRDAANSEDLLNQVGREIGVWPRAISGETEAELIYLAAPHGIHLEGQRALVVDIGGGSGELSLGAGHRPRWAVSERLGWYTRDVSSTMIYTPVDNTGPRGLSAPSMRIADWSPFVVLARIVGLSLSAYREYPRQHTNCADVRRMACLDRGGSPSANRVPTTCPSWSS